MSETSDLSAISAHVRDRAQEYAAAFARRDPFRHVVIDGFFAPEYASRLVAEFPSFERGNARNENGELGNKSTIEKIR
ncbi:MAG TPA: 2OG-Fe(II) oxygenase, partial [Rhodanobacteraceae bacterium]|nr:2OG-Fe(II) oxygenase [Rhodanobacteraceae bacterium]